MSCHPVLLFVDDCATNRDACLSAFSTHINTLSNCNFQRNRHRRSLVLAFGGYGERGSASVPGGLGAVPPAGSRAEPLVRGSGGRSPPRS